MKKIYLLRVSASGKLLSRVLLLLLSVCMPLLSIAATTFNIEITAGGMLLQPGAVPIAGTFNVAAGDNIIFSYAGTGDPR